MEIKKILDELTEKTSEAERIEAILKSKKKLWGVVKDELTALGEKYGDRRRTRMATDEDVLEFDPEAYIVRENTNVVLTRDGWIKRVGRLASVEGTRVREGDEVIAVVPGSTLDHVVFFADDGTAYTMRINEVPASSGYGEPITKFFKLDDQVTRDRRGDDRRAVRPRPDEAREQGATRRAVPAGGDERRATRCGCRSPRSAKPRQSRADATCDLREGDKVVLAKVLGQHRWVDGKRTQIVEESMFLVSADGHVIHFAIDEVNVLSGAGRGVIGIKLADGDTCHRRGAGVRPVHEDGRGDVRRRRHGARRRQADREPRREGLLRR